MKKLTIIALVLVLCLAAVGIGYAKWTGEINLQGHVSTGDLDLDIVRTSGTYVYQTGDGPTDILVEHRWSDLDPSVDLNPVAFAEVTNVSEEKDSAFLDWNNIFPIGECESFCIDMLLKNTGTIGLTVDNITWGGEVNPLVAEMFKGAAMYFADEDGNPTQEAVGPGTKIEPGEYVYAVICLQVPQNNDYMNLTAENLWLKLCYSQWAEAECDAPQTPTHA